MTRYREDSDSSGTLIAAAVGAIAGVALGILVAQKFGGFEGMKARFRERFGSADPSGADEEFHLEDFRESEGEAYAGEPFDDESEDDLGNDEDESAAEQLEQDVLEAFLADPVFRERAVDIGALEPSVIELSGWVATKAERMRATAVARKVPGVDTVINELLVGDPDSIEVPDIAPTA